MSWSSYGSCLGAMLITSGLRKAASTPKSRVPQKAKEEANGEDTPQRTKRVKRQTKSINESLEPVFSASAAETNRGSDPNSSVN